MDRDVAETWRNCFRQWPSDLERRGVLVTSFGEQIVFDAFATSDDMLLLERKAPDTVGARTVILPLPKYPGAEDRGRDQGKNVSVDGLHRAAFRRGSSTPIWRRKIRPATLSMQRAFVRLAESIFNRRTSGPFPSKTSNPRPRHRVNSIDGLRTSPYRPASRDWTTAWAAD